MSAQEDRLAALGARRADRQAQAAEKRLAQEVIDREKLEELELELGTHRVGFVEAERFVPGFPVLVIVELPNEVQFKRYSDRCAKRKDDTELVAANKELGDSCVRHPDKETLARFDAELPGIRVAAGTCAAMMCGARARAEGKE